MDEDYKIFINLTLLFQHLQRIRFQENKIIKREMGNKISQFEQRFNTNYSFIEAIHNPTYGLVKIYRKKFENYHYVMVIDRRLQQFKKQTFITSCISSNNKDNKDTIPKILHGNQREWKMQGEMKLQKLKQTLELIKRHQNDLVIPFFNYRVLQGISSPICKGNDFQCTQPVIQLHVQYHNHRLTEYLGALRAHSIPLKINQIAYILKTITLSIILLKKMEIQPTFKQINVQSIYVSSEGYIKIHPIDIITKKEKQFQHISNIEALQTDSISNPSIQIRKISKNQRSASSRGDKASNQKYSKSSMPKQRNLLSFNQSFAPQYTKLHTQKQILLKILVQIAPFTLSKSSSNKDFQRLSVIIKKGTSLEEIAQYLQNFGKPSLQGLIIDRIYDFNEKNTQTEKQALNKKLQSSKSSMDDNVHQNSIKTDRHSEQKNILQQNTRLQVSQVQRVYPKRKNSQQNLIKYQDDVKFNQIRNQNVSENKYVNNNKNVHDNRNVNFYGNGFAIPHSNLVKYEAISKISQLPNVNIQPQIGTVRPIIQNRQPVSLPLRDPGKSHQGLSQQNRQLSNQYRQT